MDKKPKTKSTILKKRRKVIKGGLGKDHRYGIIIETCDDGSGGRIAAEIGTPISYTYVKC